MDRDTREPDRRDQTLQEDSGMIGSETEEPGPGRDTSLTEPDPVAAGTDQPRATVAMSEGDPMRTRLGSHVEGAAPVADEREPELAEPAAYQLEPGWTGSAADDEPIQRAPDERTSDAGVAPATSTGEETDQARRRPPSDAV
jgi:hypothetical protein